MLLVETHPKRDRQPPCSQPRLTVRHEALRT